MSKGQRSLRDPLYGQIHGTVQKESASDGKPHKSKGSVATAAHVYSLIRKLSKKEQKHLAKLISEDGPLASVILDLCGFNKVADSFGSMVECWAKMCNAADNSSQFAALLQEKLRRRNRRSAPETIARNIVICDLRRENPRLWSQGTLGMKFSIDRRTVRRILKEEDKWRCLEKAQTNRPSGTSSRP